MKRPKTTREQGEAVILENRMTAFLRSTETPLLLRDMRFSLFFQQHLKIVKRIVLYNLLRKKHYFHLDRAEPPLFNVVLIEGKNSAPCITREETV